MDKDIFYLMRVFCSVVEYGSFSLAANKLDVQAPAVSKAIAKLEKLVGKRLLNRSTRSVEASDVGRYFYKEAISQLSSLDSSLEVVGSWASEVKGLLKITSTHAVGEDLISSTLSSFCQQFPSVTLELMFTNDIITLPSQNIDVAIRSSNALEDSCLKSKELFSVQRLVVASPSFLQKHTDLTNIDVLSSLDCLNFKHRKRLDLWPFTYQGQSRRIIANTLIACNSYAALRRMCIEGLGIARLFEYQIKDELKNGELVELWPDADWGVQSIHAIYHEKISNSPKLAAFVEHFQKQVLPI